jgi:putative intracellular protease/amidase
MPSALFVVSEEGYWGEECVEPLEILEGAGYDVTVATPTGGPAVVDERSVDPDEVGQTLAEHVRDVDESDPRLNDPDPVAAVSMAEYDALVLPGGHGTVWDVNQDRHVRQFLLRAVAGEAGAALVVCHAVGVLAFTREADGSFLVADRSVTGFPNEWEVDLLDEEDRLPDGRKLPYLVEDEVKAAGADWTADPAAETSVRVDGDLITARGPASSGEGARTLLARLSGD